MGHQPVATARRLTAQQRRDVLLEAAAEVVAEQGFRGATLAEVARRGGVTKSLLYKHFADKEQLGAVLLEREAALLGDRLAAATAGPGDARARLLRAVDAFLAHVEERSFARQLLFRDPEAGGAVAATHDRLHAEATAALARMLAADPALLPDDPDRATALELAAQLARTSLNGLASWWLAHPEVPREDAVSRAVDLLWSALEALREP